MLEICLKMIQKLKTCSKCLELKPIWKNSEGNRYCKGCWSAHSKSSKPIPYHKQKPIAPRSSKRIKQDVIYSRERKLFLDKYSMCQAHLPGICASLSTDVHHACGRTGDLYLNQEHWVALCRQCHNYLELNPIIAKELGFSKSRLIN